MDTKKAEKLERHRKEIRKKSFLNITILFLVATGIAFYAGGYMARFLSLILSMNMVVWFSGIFVSFLIFIWVLPIFHYRETVNMRSDKDREYYRDRGPEKTPIIQVLEDRNWKEVDSSEDKVELKTYPTKIHEIFGRKTTVSLEKVEEKDDYETTVLKTGEKEISRTKTEYSEEEEGLEMKEITVSRSRVTPVYIEVTLYLMPELEEMMEDMEEKVEIIDEKIDYRLKQYEFD